MTVDELYERLIDDGYFTEKELELVTTINGYSIETLNDCIYARYAEDYEQLYDLDEDDYWNEDEEDLSLAEKIESVLYDYNIISGDIVEEADRVVVAGIHNDELSDVLDAFNEEELGVYELKGNDIIFNKDDYCDEDE